MDSALVAGQRFANDFIVEGFLSEGGMSTLYVATQEATRKRCALKVMKAGSVRDPSLRSRFAQEAMVSSAIASEHKVEVLAAGVDTLTEMPWIAMELLDGETLTAFLQRHGRMSAAAVHGILEQLLHCLAAAHRVGVVHRDLKPDNVFVANAHRVGASSTIKVLDFGIAKLVAGASRPETQAMGSPFWMAPEQASRGAAVTPATDVFSAGLLAFWLLTGKRYWLSAHDPRSGLIEFLRELLQSELPTASQRAAELDAAGTLPAGFDAWFSRCVARPTAERFADANVAWEAWLADVAPRLAQATPPAASAAPAVKRGGAESAAASNVGAAPRARVLWFSAAALVATAVGAMVALTPLFPWALKPAVEEGTAMIVAVPPEPPGATTTESSSTENAASEVNAAPTQPTADSPPPPPLPTTTTTTTTAATPAPAQSQPEPRLTAQPAASLQQTSASPQAQTPPQPSSPSAKPSEQPAPSTRPSTPPASCGCSAKDLLCLAACRNQR